VESARVDRFLWAVRIYKTRSASTAACRGGHVRINGAPAKASSMVHCGDRVVARQGDRERVLEVLEVIDRRVGAPLVARCVLDHSPPPPAAEFVAPAFVRDPSSGRPTKKDRRALDRVRRA